jgi:hypothetical protein
MILTAFPLQQWLYERASLLPYTYIVLLLRNFASFVTLKRDDLPV